MLKPTGDPTYRTEHSDLDDLREFEKWQDILEFCGENLRATINAIELLEMRQ